CALIPYSNPDVW
nr:immunoglobulin heavy chain junction region [Mus musculus]